jgi:peptidoglycan/LPS O-acetylase OafA/YrhL
MNKAIAVFSILMGGGLITTWIVLFLFKPIIAESTFELVFLLIAEVLTGTSLILAGYAVIRRQRWGDHLQFVAFGMLLYCATFSIGALGQGGNIPIIAFFSSVASLTFVSIGYLLYTHSKSQVEEP